MKLFNWFKRNKKIEFYPEYIKKGDLIIDVVYFRIGDIIRIITINKGINLSKIFPDCNKSKSDVTGSITCIKDIVPDSNYYNDVIKIINIKFNNKYRNSKESLFRDAAKMLSEVKGEVKIWENDFKRR